jgi:hypothetical protein
VRHAIETGQDITVNLKDGMRFYLAWEKGVYHNPIDGTEYHAEWESYTPANGSSQPPSNSHVKMREIVFLVQPPPEHVRVEDVVAYINSIVAIFERSLPVAPIPLAGVQSMGRQVIVQLEIPKCPDWLKMSATPSMDGLPAQSILPQIAALQQPNALSRVHFQLILDLWGYDGPSTRFS